VGVLEYFGYANERFDTPLYQIWPWFKMLIEKKAYKKGLE